MSKTLHENTLTYNIQERCEWTEIMSQQDQNLSSPSIVDLRSWAP